jgi:molybdenum-dependent DNA-binding transcriptional regulator ModE
MRFMRILGYVDDIARSGSIRKAAERLNLTASALNRRIMDIEEELGTLLFERRPRGVRLTSAGELFLDLARRQLSDTERMLSQIEELKGMRRGVVRIAGSQALAHSFLPASLAQFRKQFTKDPTALYTWVGSGMENLTAINLTLDQVMNLAWTCTHVSAAGVQNLVLPGGTGMEGTLSVVHIDTSRAKAIFSDAQKDAVVSKKNAPASPAPG